jgi:hypothetical protein
LSSKDNIVRYRQGDRMRLWKIRPKCSPTYHVFIKTNAEIFRGQK